MDEITLQKIANLLTNIGLMAAVVGLIRIWPPQTDFQILIYVALAIIPPIAIVGWRWS